METLAEHHAGICNTTKEIEIKIYFIRKLLETRQLNANGTWWNDMV